MMFACLVQRHDWEHHPDFNMLQVRRCRRCGRCEADFPATGNWVRTRRVERGEHLTALGEKEQS